MYFLNTDLILFNLFLFYFYSVVLIKNVKNIFDKRWHAFNKDRLQR